MSPPRIKLWPSLPISVYARRPRPRLPFPLDQDGCTLVARGRQGLAVGCRLVGLRPGDEVLVPAYHCGTEVAALLEAGLRCRFYEGTARLEPSADELDALARDRTRALLVIHYYGFTQDAPRWRAWCDSRGLVLIEDCAHAWLASVDGRPAGSFGDLAIFSFYKTVPLPNGGALVAPSRAPAVAHDRSLGLAGVVKKHVSWAMRHSSRLDRLLAPMERPYEPDFAVPPASGPPAATRFLLRRLADEEVAVRRRRHYRRLLAALRGHVPPPFAELDDGACPLVFPLFVEDAAELAPRLEALGVVARPFWPRVHPALRLDEFPVAAAWHRRLLALPVHQSLSEDDVDRVAATAGAVLEAT